MNEPTHLQTLQRNLVEYRDQLRRIEAKLADLARETEDYLAQRENFQALIKQTERGLRRALFPSSEQGHEMTGALPADPRYEPRKEARHDNRYSSRREPSRYEPRYEEPRYEEPRYEEPLYDDPRYEPRYEPRPEPHHEQPAYRSSETPSYRPASAPPMRASDLDEAIENVHRDEQQSNVRFADFRIPQAATIVLREAKTPLHVSEIYRRLSEGGFEFRGQHQLITLAVSLSRSKRFRKVAPGTFELDPSFRAGQVA